MKKQLVMTLKKDNIAKMSVDKKQARRHVGKPVYLKIFFYPQEVEGGDLMNFSSFFLKVGYEEFNIHEQLRE